MFSFDHCWMQAHVSRYPGPEALYDYELFVLVNHEGQIDNTLLFLRKKISFNHSSTRANMA